jgi:hypothetical protein
MNDRIPGTTYFNPIWHGKWRIYISDHFYPNDSYAYVHDDYDGAKDARDSRCGHAHSVEEAKQEIDEYENNRG